MEEQNEKIKEDVNKREEKYKALVDFFKNDMEIKMSLMNLAPKEIDEYSEESRLEYLEKLFSELKDMEMKFNGIVKNFKMGMQMEQKIKNYFDNAKKELSELGYGRKHEKLQKIYQNIFADMRPELIEKSKEVFLGYVISDKQGELETIIDNVKSINELLHVTHSSIVNDENFLQAMPIIGTKENYINLYGEENDISKKIFEEFPNDLEVGITDIVSMKNRTLMMVRDRGHALTIDIDSSDKDNIYVSYFVPKICNLDMVKALPGINTSSITKNGASGLFETKKEHISKSIFNFINSVPTDLDMPQSENLVQDSELSDENTLKQTAIFDIEDAKSLATGRKYSKIKEVYAKFKDFIKTKFNTKLKGEEKKDDEPSR